MPASNSLETVAGQLTNFRVITARPDPSMSPLIPGCFFFQHCPETCTVKTALYARSGVMANKYQPMRQASLFTRSSPSTLALGNHGVHDH